LKQTESNFAEKFDAKDKQFLQTKVAQKGTKESVQKEVE